MTEEQLPDVPGSDDRSEYDSGWKDIIEELFQPFLEFFFPEIAADIDFTRKPEFLSNELRKIAPEAMAPNRVSDELVKVYLRNQEPKILCIFIHIEVQGYTDKDFMKRMFTYFYRITDYYKGTTDEVISLAILTDDDKKFRPDKKVFKLGRWGFELRLKIPMVKLLDFLTNPKKRKFLEESKSPIAFIVLAHLKCLKTKNADEITRYDMKMELIRQCYRNGYGKERTRSLLRFVDWIVRLPNYLQEKLKEETSKMKEEQTMPFISIWEKDAWESGKKIGKAEGKEEGIELNQLETIKRTIKMNLSLNRISEITGLTIEKISELIAKDAAKSVNNPGPQMVANI